MVKRCCYGICNSDSRYPERLEAGKVFFIPFPKRIKNVDKCRRWIKACGRPHSQLSVDKVTKDVYICSKHFVGGNGPSLKHPDPVPADGSLTFTARKPPRNKYTDTKTRRKKLIFQTNDNEEASFHNVQSEADDSSNENWKETQTENKWADPLEMLLVVAENESLKADLSRKNQDNHQNVPYACACACFTFDSVKNDNLAIRYYSGFTKEEFSAIFKFLAPNEHKCPFKPSKKYSLSLQDQLFFTLCKLRNNFDFKDLAFRFQISPQNAGLCFDDWINYMFLRFGEICIWPEREIIISNMPEKFRKDFPSTVAIVDCTEIKIQKPSSLVVQSQTYSDYKSSNTLKSLIACDPRGSLLFSSCLFSGSISDKEIFDKSGFADLLKSLVNEGRIKPGDGIMADKGFNIEKDVNSCGLNLNIPPFAHSGSQMTKAESLHTMKIAAHRVHVERIIAAIKKFKIVSSCVPLTLFKKINQIWFVCSFLTTFQKPIIQKE